MSIRRIKASDIQRRRRARLDDDLLPDLKGRDRLHRGHLDNDLEDDGLSNLRRKRLQRSRGLDKLSQNENKTTNFRLNKDLKIAGRLIKRGSILSVKSSDVLEDVGNVTRVPYRRNSEDKIALRNRLRKAFARRRRMI